MLEISVHTNHNLIVDYKKVNKKYRKLFSILLAMPNVEELIRNADKATNDYNETLSRFNASTNDFDKTMDELNKVLDKVDMDTLPKKVRAGIDVSQTGKYKDFLTGESTPSSISDLKGANLEYFEKMIPEQVKEEKLGMIEKTIKGIEEKTRNIDQACKTFNKIVEDIAWIIKNPAEALYMVLTWIVQYGTWIVIIYLIYNILLLGFSSSKGNTEVSDKIKARINSTILSYIALLILTLLLKCYIGY